MPWRVAPQKRREPKSELTLVDRRLLSFGEEFTGRIGCSSKAPVASSFCGKVPPGRLEPSRDHREGPCAHYMGLASGSQRPEPLSSSNNHSHWKFRPSFAKSSSLIDNSFRNSGVVDEDSDYTNNPRPRSTGGVFGVWGCYANNGSAHPLRIYIAITSDSFWHTAIGLR